MRENLCKLITHINRTNQHPDDKCPEYLFYDRILTDEMVDLALNVPLRVPTYIDELAKKVGKPVEYVAKLVDEIVHIGLFYYDRDEKGVDRIILEIFAPGNFELTAMDPKITDAHPEMAYAFPMYGQLLGQRQAAMFPMGQAVMRAIPVEEAIQNEPKKVCYEEVSHWVEKYAPSLAVAHCECRRLRRMNGDGSADLEGEWCIELGEFAESCIRTGKARRITKEEAYEILRKAEVHGYVHQLSNMDGRDKSVFICNCSWDSCIGLRLSWYTGTPNMSRSNFVAEVTKENCVACGGCVEVCPQNAVKLGQKLCEKKPTKIHDRKLPDDHKWTEADWQPDLLTNRLNVIPETGTSPCKTNCPAHIAVQGYLKLASQGKYREALALIKKENPLPAVCGSICNRRCESVCTRGDVDEAVGIDNVKKFIAQQDMNAEHRFVPKKKFDHGKKIAVIGSGPAGISCAYYLAVYGHQVTVFEKEEKLGGMLTLGIPSFRLEKTVVESEIDVLRELGVEFKTGIEIGKDVTLQQLREQGYQGFYLAIGAQGGRKLGIEGEDAEGVLSGIDFLKSINLGTQRDLVGKTVVIGGGNVAIDVARSAARKGTDGVMMYCLESRSTMPASAEELAEAEEENITINCGWGPKRILTEDGKVVGVELKRCLSTIDPETGRFSPKYDENDTVTVACSNVIAAIGQSIQWGNLLDGSAVELNPNGTAKTVPIQDYESYQQAKVCGLEPMKVHLPEAIEVWQTAEPDIFVGGDAFTGPRFAIDAIAAGKEGAESLHRYVWEGHSLILARDRRRYHYLNKDNMVVENYDNTPRQIPALDPEKAMAFADPRMTLTEDQVKKETGRCLGCGAAHVDQNVCIGCGLCTTRCEFDAIHISKKFDAWPVPYEKMVPHLLKNAVARQGRILMRKLKGKE